MLRSISQAAGHAGCSTPTVRYYEAIGLIPNAERTAGGRRSYGWPDVMRLQFIRHARDFGMSIDQIRELLVPEADGPGGCIKAREIVQQRINEVKEMRLEFARLEASLDAMARRCDATCGPSLALPCMIFEDIADSAA